MPTKEELKERVHALTNQVQSILGYLELEEYEKAMIHTKLARKELQALTRAVEALTSGLHKDINL